MEYFPKNYPKKPLKQAGCDFSETGNPGLK
jgi:hypothetical protein